MPLLLPLTDPAALVAALLAASVESCRARRAPAKATRRKGAKRLCRIIESSSGTFSGLETHCNCVHDGGAVVSGSYTG